MSCFVGCVTGVTSYEMQRIFNRIKMRLGAPVVGVELDEKQLEAFLCDGIEEYSVHVNDWFLQNKLGEMLGLPSDIDFTLKYVSNSFYLERQWAASIGEQIGFGANGMREYKTDYITLTAGTQDYSIPSNREVSEILWFTPSFVNLFGLDPFANTNIAFSEFGASFAGQTLYHVMPVFDTLLTATAAELRNRVRGSEYSYSIHPGPNGTRNLKLYPVPSNVTPGGINAGIGGAAGTPGTVYYRYYDKLSVSGNPGFSGNTMNPGWSASTSYEQGNGLVSSFADAQLNVINYEQLNSNAKKWILNYAFAMAAQTLAVMIRGKFGGELPIPDAQLRLNSDSLNSVAEKEFDRLFARLKEELERLSYKNMLEERAAIQESINKSQSYGPLDIYVF